MPQVVSNAIGAMAVESESSQTVKGVESAKEPPQKTVSDTAVDHVATLDIFTAVESVPPVATTARDVEIVDLERILERARRELRSSNPGTQQKKLNARISELQSTISRLRETGSELDKANANTGEADVGKSEATQQAMPPATLQTLLVEAQGQVEVVGGDKTGEEIRAEETEEARAGAKAVPGEDS